MLRSKLPTLLIVMAGVLCLILIAGGWMALKESGEQVRDAYCLDWASAAIVQHLDDNKGHWPEDWNDLKPAFDKVTASDQSFGFAEVRSRVNVDFGVNPAEPIAANRSFVTLRSGRGVRWDNPDPDERIRTRLRELATND
jgi:hypothetical protein